MKLRLMTKVLLLAGGVLNAFAPMAQAFYNPSAGRWLSRDPIEEKGGRNLYSFVGNNPVTWIDRLGLDIWIIRSCAWPGHEWIVGSNADGKTYWMADFRPDTASGWGINCKGKLWLLETGGYDPNNLLPCLSIRKHIETSPETDEKIKNAVEKMANDPKQKRYHWLYYNCQTFCDTAASVAQELEAEIEKKAQEGAADETTKSQ